MAKSIINIAFILFLLVSFVMGAYLYSTNTLKQSLYQMGQTRESLENQDESEPDEEPEQDDEEEQEQEDEDEEEPEPDCPDVLMKRGNVYYLYKSSDPNNSVTFNTLDEYQTYLDEAKASGKNCPVLFVQQENNAQGQDVYRVRDTPIVSQQEPGLPAQAPVPPPIMMSTTPQQMKYLDASRVNAPYNQGNYAGFDPYGLFVGRITEIDQEAQKEEKQQLSDNPMDPNWGGVLYTQKAVDSGKYKDNEITKPKYYTPKSQFIPILNSGMPYPQDQYE